VDVDVVPGAREHAFALDDPAGAKRLAAATVCGGRGVVVGAGLTGIEAAIELAERRRKLAVTLVAGGVLGADLSSAGARHVRTSWRASASSCASTRGSAPWSATAAVLADGERLPFDACLWSAGSRRRRWRARPGSGGRARARPRGSDAAGTGIPGGLRRRRRRGGEGPDGRSLRMACATAMPMVSTRRKGCARRRRRDTASVPIGYAIRCVSLGRRSGLVQQVDEADRAVERALTGRAGAIVKELRLSEHGPLHPRRARLRLPFYRWPRPKPARPSLPAAAPAGE